jgi:pimeloyl-ACP methyl ester carboxylesterase
LEPVLIDFLEILGEKIAFQSRTGTGTGVMWLGGWRSDMMGTKATFLDSLAQRHGFPFVRFDYSGHGLSSGDWENGSISKWLNESRVFFEHEDLDDRVLVGSSMGAWIALLLIKHLKEKGLEKKVKALVLISPAPDFTSDLIEPNLTDLERDTLAIHGFFIEKSDHLSDQNKWSRDFLADGRLNSVFKTPIETLCPVHIIHGLKDKDVPYAHALKLAAYLPQEFVTMSLIQDGDHRLSREKDLNLLEKTVQKLRIM